MSGTRLLRYLLIGTALIGLGLHSRVSAAEERVAELPLLFSKEGTDIKTSACLRVREKIYHADQAPWESFRSQAQTSPEAELRETIGAMLNKDSSRLRELSHPLWGREPKKFQQQAMAYFLLMGPLNLGDVWGYYRFGDQLAFFLELGTTPKSSFADFPFALEATGNFGFLPYKSKSLTLGFVRQWFNSAWGPAKSQSPEYCSPSLLERMTHKVRVEGGARNPELAPELLLAGKVITDQGIEDEPYAALRDKISALKNALRLGEMAEYFDGFTERGRTKIEAWFSNAQEEERRKYTESFLGQDPFFVFNAEPLFIVYTRTVYSGVQVLYFVRDNNGGFRWANSAYGTIFDNIFKSRRFKQAASQEKPFDGWKINDSTPPN